MYHIDIKSIKDSLYKVILTSNNIIYKETIVKTINEAYDIQYNWEKNINNIIPNIFRTREEIYYEDDDANYNYYDYPTSCIENV